MAIASVGSFGIANSTVSGTTLALTPTVTLEVGNLAMLVVAADNAAVGTSPNAEFGHKVSNITSVTDTGSNVWHKLGEIAGNQAAAAGASVALYYCIITTQLTTSSTVTVTFSAAITSKAASGWEYTLGGSALAVERIRFRATAATDPPSMTLDDLPSRQYLFFRARATETNVSAWTSTTNFTPITEAIASAGSNPASMSANGEFRINTSTSETSDPTKGSTDGADIFIALWEGAQSASSPYVVTGNTIQSGTGNPTPAWPLGHEVDDIALLVCESSNGEAVTLTTANGFAEVPSSPQDASNSRLTVFWCRATSTSMASPVTNDPGDHINHHMYLIRGCHNSGNPWDVMTGDTGVSSTSVTVPQVTTTVDRCLILWICSQGTDVSSDEFSGWANTGSTRFEELDAISTAAGNGGGHGIAYGYKATAGATGTATATLVTASGQGRITIALKPPATGTGYTQSVAGGITPSGVMFKDGRKILSGGATPSGDILKTGNKTLSGSLATIVGTLSKQTSKPLSGALSSIAGTLATSKFVVVLLDGALTLAGSLLKSTNKLLSGDITPTGTASKISGKIFAGSITPTGALTKQAQKLLTGALSGIVGTLTSIRAYTRSLAGEITPAGTVNKSSTKTFAGSITPSGSVLKTAQKAFAGTLTLAGTIVKSTNKFLSGVLTLAGDLATQLSSGGQTFFKDLAGTLTSSGVLAKVTSKLFSGGITPTGAMIKSTLKNLAGTLTGSGALAVSRVIALALGGTLAFQGTLLKLTAKSQEGALTPGGGISKHTSKLLSGAIISSGLLTVTRVIVKALDGAITFLGTLQKSTTKNVSGSITPTGSLSRFFSKLLAGILAPIGSLNKSTSKTFSGVLTMSGLLTTLFNFVEHIAKVYLLGSRIKVLNFMGEKLLQLTLLGSKEDQIDLSGNIK